MNRDQDLSDINLYTFCSKHWIDHKERPPQFFGFHNKPTWPLEENYSRWMLILYKPWRKIDDDLKDINDETFATTLCNFWRNSLFPASIRAEIMRAKLQVNAVDINEGGELGGDDDLR